MGRTFFIACYTQREALLSKTGFRNPMGLDFNCIFLSNNIDNVDELRIQIRVIIMKIIKLTADRVCSRHFILSLSHQKLVIFTFAFHSGFLSTTTKLVLAL